MREIKFRAWDGKRIFIIRKLSMFKSWKGNKTGQKYSVTEDYYTCNPKAIMQFTGLKDKNDKEIYEGDIVKAFYEEEEEYGIVYWDEKIAGFDVKGKKWKSVENLYCSWKYYEVIGNKFENPEFLK